MLEYAQFLRLRRHIVARRERAEQARRLAGELGDALANRSLLQRARELERQAEMLEDQLASLTEGALAAAQ
ncbi:MAG TPA: hypothetical protein VGP48_05775 [Stellaceae bacterium]|jgi:predicted  nucleic acid-binding Zn-ribbon protein|nr:hypothetical protein [Stellaceae bacterium]